MDKAEVIKLAKDYKELVQRHLAIDALYLYGSYASGTQNESSDIDIAIFVKKTSDDFFKDTPLLWKLRRQVSSLIEPVLFDENDKNSPLYTQVMSTGIAI